LNGGGVGGIGVAEPKQEQQLVAKDAARQTRERIIERNLPCSIELQSPLRASDSGE
jgi:hypothetical protein